MKTLQYYYVSIIKIYIDCKIYIVILTIRALLQFMNYILLKRYYVNTVLY